jgi:hypothetical protein
MFVFDQIGLTTTKPQPGELGRAKRCWVTNPRHHLEHAEFLRYAPGGPYPIWCAPIRTSPFALRRSSRTSRGSIPQFVIGDFVRVVFIRRYSWLGA